MAKLGDPEVTMERLRFFCMGRELKDDLFIYSYDIQDEMAVQCMLKAKA